MMGEERKKEKVTTHRVITWSCDQVILLFTLMLAPTLDDSYH